MATVAELALAAFYRYSINDNDSPSQSELDDAKAHWDDCYASRIQQALADHQIADTEENRAWVQLFASMAPGTNKKQLEHGCELFAHI
jgi:hypothetical protein